ncbi:MAG: hypothetical protein KGZ40_03665 [Clostridiales bacterium]|nr:hypothetical protein [Clostridiales bacterium]
MKTFFSDAATDEAGTRAATLEAIGPRAHTVSAYPAHTRLCARVAVYDSPVAAPRTEDVEESEARELIDSLSSRVYSLAQEAGGRLPYTVIRELVENFVHANFAEPVVSILDGGSTIRFADQGPGLPDKKRAILPGFTTATGEMKRIIRGVGSGLPIVQEWLGLSGGFLLIEDNLRDGTVVTISFAQASHQADSIPDSAHDTAPHYPVDLPALSTRQKQVLSLVLELGEAGPTIVSRELRVALSTAYRDLAFLEESGLIRADESGKRVLTERGSQYLDSLLTR